MIRFDELSEAEKEAADAWFKTLAIQEVVAIMIDAGDCPRCGGDGTVEVCFGHAHDPHARRETAPCSLCKADERARWESVADSRSKGEPL